MKVVIFAGGFGTRITEETIVKPKPMVEIGGMPIIWHIMKIYSSYGYNEFVVCLGYKGMYIKDFFSRYFLYHSDVTFELKKNNMIVHNNGIEDWKITLIDTKLETMTGGRLKLVREYLNNSTFLLTYGDTVADVNISELVKFHKEQNLFATLTAVQPPGRFGVISLQENENKVSKFKEKPKGDGAWINGGFFVLEPNIFDYISGLETVWEEKPLQQLASDGQLAAYRHYGFWESLETLRDKNHLESLWKTNNAPWKRW